LDIPISILTNKLNFIDHFTVKFGPRIPKEDRTLDFSPAKRIWNHFESLTSRQTPEGDPASVAGTQSPVQTIDIRVVLEVAWPTESSAAAPEVELIRRWKIQHRRPALVVCIEPVAVAEAMWEKLLFEQCVYEHQSGIAALFAQTFPELEPFVEVQYGGGGYQEMICSRS
jgi:hypothetical protein